MIPSGATDSPCFFFPGETRAPTSGPDASTVTDARSVFDTSTATVAPAGTVTSRTAAPVSRAVTSAGPGLLS